MALPAIVQSKGAGNSAAGTSQTVTLTSPSTQHNTLTAVIEQGNISAVTAPAGWVQTAIDTNGTTRQISIWTLADCAGGVSAYAFSQATSGPFAVTVHELSGCDLSTPTGVTAHSDQTGSTAVAVGPTGTPTRSPALVLVGIGYNRAAAVTFSGVTSGYTADATAASTGQTPNANIATYYQAFSTMAAAQSFAATASASSNFQEVMVIFSGAPIVAQATFAGIGTGTDNAEQDATVSGGGQGGASGSGQSQGTATPSGQGGATDSAQSQGTASPGGLGGLAPSGQQQGAASPGGTGGARPSGQQQGAASLGGQGGLAPGAQALANALFAGLGALTGAAQLLGRAVLAGLGSLTGAATVLTPSAAGIVAVSDSAVGVAIASDSAVGTVALGDSAVGVGVLSDGPTGAS